MKRKSSLDGMSLNIYAGFWRRAVALLLDMIILVVFFATAGFIISKFAGIPNPYTPDKLYKDTGFFDLISLFITIVYFISFHSSDYQATPGKQIMSCYVVDKNGKKISTARSVGRYFSQILSGLLLIGYFMAGLTKKKRALHDMIAGTYVIKS